jgi:ElaB/YqjD/DUF883 family membrane-anchored ribosome-binding protein
MENKEISQTHDALVEDAAKLKKNVSKIADDAKEHALAHVNAVKSRANDQVEKAFDYVREHPVHALLGAFALGLFVGITRRR